MSNKKFCLKCSSEIEKHKKFCNQSCAAIYNNQKRKESGWRHSESSKQQISQSVKKNPAGFVLNAKKYGGKKAWHKTIKVERITKICPECQLPFLSKVGKYEGKYCSRACHMKNSGGLRPNSTRVHRVIYNGIQLDSGAEKIFAEQLDKANISWIKNKTKGFKFILNGKPGTYYPDFYLPDFDIWVEVKGKRYIREGDEIRRASVDKPVILLISNHFRKELPIFISNLLAMTTGLEPATSSTKGRSKMLNS